MLNDVGLSSAGDMGGSGVRRETDNQTGCAGIPVRGEQASESRDEVDSSGVLHLVGEYVHVCMSSSGEDMAGRSLVLSK